jgi:hypothetical protein
VRSACSAGVYLEQIMTAEDYAKVIETALAMGPTPGPWRATRGIDELCDPGTTVWHRESWGVYTDADCHGQAAADATLTAACHPEAMRALLEERNAMKRHIIRVLSAWYMTPLPASGDGMLQERMEDLRAHLTTTADNQPEGEA